MPSAPASSAPLVQLGELDKPAWPLARRNVISMAQMINVDRFACPCRCLARLSLCLPPCVGEFNITRRRLMASPKAPWAICATLSLSHFLEPVDAGEKSCTSGRLSLAFGPPSGHWPAVKVLRQEKAASQADRQASCSRAQISRFRASKCAPTTPHKLQGATSWPAEAKPANRSLAGQRATSGQMAPPTAARGLASWCCAPFFCPTGAAWREVSIKLAA